MANTCPICDKGTLVEKLEHHTVPYKSYLLNVPLVYSHCSHCEADVATGDQLKRNKEACLEMKTDVRLHINQLMASTF